METFQSRADLKQAYERLLVRERRLLDRLTEEEPGDLRELVDAQRTTMERIETTETRRPELKGTIRSWRRDVIETFAELREQTIDRIRTHQSRIESTIDSLEQSAELMRHYMQGRRRSEEHASYRMDRTI